MPAYNAVLALHSSLKPHTPRHRGNKHRWHPLPFFGHFRRGKCVHAQHLFAQLADLLDHDLPHRALLRLGDPVHFGGEEEFFQVGEGEAVGQLADLCHALSAGPPWLSLPFFARVLRSGWSCSASSL